MATEKCAVCGELGTPWESCQELGTGLHMCCTCSYLYPVFRRAFEKYMEYISHEFDVDGEPVLDSVRPRAVKKMTYLLIRRWYNERMVK